MDKVHRHLNLEDQGLRRLEKSSKHSPAAAKQNPIGQSNLIIQHLADNDSDKVQNTKFKFKA